jgi:hypothetical protein
MAREYGVSKVVGDNFSGGVRADLVVRKQGTTYEATKRTRSDIYSQPGDLVECSPKSCSPRGA